MNSPKEQLIIDKIKAGEIVVLPTDTLYGIHTTAFSKNAVEKVYKVRFRAKTKPLIILISSIEQLKLFKIEVDNKTKKILEKYWPGKVSIILPCPYKEFEYLHKGTNSLAFRIPNKRNLLQLIEKTGPLVSTSVNPEGREPAKTIKEAKLYFGDKIQYYLDEGELDSLPSTIIRIKEGKLEILRQGEVKIE